MVIRGLVLSAERKDDTLGEFLKVKLSDDSAGEVNVKLQLANGEGAAVVRGATVEGTVMKVDHAAIADKDGKRAPFSWVQFRCAVGDWRVV